MSACKLCAIPVSHRVHTAHAVVDVYMDEVSMT